MEQHTGADEPKTLTGFDVRRVDDEPQTRPALQTPPARTSLAPADHARIAVAVERGDAARALFHYGLALPDLPLVQRSCAERSAADPEFARAFVEAVAVARRG